MDSRMKRTGVLLGNLKRILKRYHDPVLWTWLELFSPVRGTNSETARYLLLFFRFNIHAIKGIVTLLLWTLWGWTPYELPSYNENLSIWESRGSSEDFRVNWCFAFFKVKFNVKLRNFLLFYRNDASYSSERGGDIFETVCTRSSPTTKVS